jgi:hypothetical protein
LSAKLRFERANYLDMYLSVYAELCVHSHNNLRALDDRHIEKSGDDCRIVFFRPNRLQEIEHFLENASCCAVDALRQISKVAKLGKGTNFEAVNVALIDVRKLFSVVE